MATRSRSLAALLALALLLGAPSSGLVAAAASGGRVHGVLLDADGRPAAGYALLLLDAEGLEVARGAASSTGHYSVAHVPRGTFTLVVEGPDGSRAAVAAAPLAVRGAAYRLNLRLVEQGDEDTAVPTTSGSWWGNLPTTGKVWAVAGGLAMTAFVVAVIDDDGETPASPF
ncbi:MAG TPA: carboxypeptidase-like regulatory domain-containing protein [Candidatus Polarisedimenticolaceae bacterium]|nr:carboxypeptidase-like regulatory domain-containing protein [Candidatus Polarisedimenticolaceae bacterium]